jgi:hypothetical protein
MATSTPDTYWTLVDERRDDRGGKILTQTFEHQLPHGKLMRTMTLYYESVAEAVVFVPAATKGAAV